MNQEPVIYNVDEVKVDIIKNHIAMIGDKQFKKVVKLLDKQIIEDNKKKKGKK